MNLSREQRDDALRDVLALIIAVLDRDTRGFDAIIAAQGGDYWPLASTAAAMLIAGLADAGYDVRQWVAAMRAHSEASRQP